MHQPVYLVDSSIVIDVLNQKLGRFELVQQLLGQGVTIAAVALTNTLVLVTFNEKDFSISELQVYPLPVI